MPMKIVFYLWTVHVPLLLLHGVLVLSANSLRRGLFFKKDVEDTWDIEDNDGSSDGSFFDVIPPSVGVPVGQRTPVPSPLPTPNDSNQEEPSTPPPTVPFFGYKFQPETASDIIKAVDLSTRVYKFKSTDTFSEADGEFFFQVGTRDAFAIAEEADKCYVAFRATQPPGSTEDYKIEDLKGNIKDVIGNLGAQKALISSMDGYTTCTVTEEYRNSYVRVQSQVEIQIEQRCEDKELILTGHSQGTATAQIAALRLKNMNPQLYLFAPAPVFFGGCNAIPAERILNFVNTNFDNDISGTLTSLEYDIVPFVDIFLKDPFLKEILDPSTAAVGSVDGQLEGFIRDLFDSADNLARILKSLEDGGIAGSYKGLYIVLHPEGKANAAFVSSRNLLIDANTKVDILNLIEALNSDRDPFELAVNTHSPFKYDKKVKKLFEPEGETILVNGFDVGEPCPVGATFVCKDICVSRGPLLEGGVCSDLSPGSPGSSCIPIVNPCQDGLVCVETTCRTL